MRQSTSYLPFLQLAKVLLIALGAIAKGYRMPCAANEGFVRIQYKCLVPIYVFPEMKLGSLLIPKIEL
jgi:hypothetical protein